jgi:copper resistance protein B
MNALRLSSLAAALTLLATAAAAQMPPALDQPELVTGMEPFVGGMPPVEDRGVFAHALLNQNEGRYNGINTQYRWSGEAWAGTDYNRLWIRSEGTVAKGKVEDGIQEFLFSRAITTFFDLQGGLRSDLDSLPTRNWASLGIEGLAPGFFNIEATGYASAQGHLSARFEGYYDLLITNRLILQPQIELTFYSKSDPSREVGPGLSEIDAGLRLRYGFTRKLAPYIGVTYEGKYGQTANFAKQAGQSTSDFRFTFGLRIWL